MRILNWLIGADEGPDYEKHEWFAGLEFSQDWTSSRLGTWHRLFEPIRGEVRSILEIGSYEGRSAVCFLNFFPGASITCIDPFGEGSQGAENRFDSNTSAFKGRVRKIKGRSIPELDRLSEAGETFDIIYIDGNHARDIVLMDSLLAWQALKPGGILIWDDYLLMLETGRRHRPKQAVDTFLRLHRQRLRVLHRGYQVIARRKFGKVK